MTKFLDLRNKVKPHIETLHKTARKQHPWCVELIKMVVVVAIVTTAVHGISRADDYVHSRPAPEVKAFSLSGLVSANTDSSLSINNATGEDSTNLTSYSFNTNTLKKIETNQDLPLSISDIQIGDRVVIQGTFVDTTYTAIHIIDFTSVPATTTATTTDELASTTPEIATTTATSTDELASSTNETSSSTPSFIDDVYNAVTDTVQNVVDTIVDTITDLFTGTTTPDATTTDEVATTTDIITETTTEEVTTPTTTPEIITETPPTPDIEPTVPTDDTTTSTTTENNN